VIRNFLRKAKNRTRRRRRRYFAATCYDQSDANNINCWLFFRSDYASEQSRQITLDDSSFDSYCTKTAVVLPRHLPTNERLLLCQF